MFTNDIVIHRFSRDRFSDRQIVWIARSFICVIVFITYLLSLAEPRRVFTLGVWCFSGFASLFPLVFASVYWRRTTRSGAITSVVVAAVAWFFLFRQSNYGERPEYLIWNMMPVTIVFAASLITLVTVSLITSPPSQETIRKYFDPR